MIFSSLKIELNFLKYWADKIINKNVKLNS